MNRETTDVLPTETLAHIQSAGCKAQKKSVIGAHKRCWKYLIGAISTHGEAARDLEFIGGDKDKQLEKLWAETKIGDILPWDEIADEAERLLESDQATRRAPEDDQADKEQEGNQEVDRDETDTHMETIFGRRRPDSIAVEWRSKVLYVLEFKRTSDQRRNYQERGEARARAQHDVLVKTRSYAHTLHKGRVRGVRDGDGKLRWEKLFKGWTTLNEIWRGAVRRKWAGRLREERTRK